MKISAEEIKKIAVVPPGSQGRPDGNGRETAERRILSYMDLLSQVDVTDVKPTAHAVSMSNVMRDDVPQPSLANQAFQNAPEQADGYFKVPKVIQD